MTGIDDLGTIEYEENLGSVWADEPAAFTPWLERNIELLAYYKFHTDLLRRLHGVTSGFQTRSSGNGRYLTFLKELKQGFRLATAFEMGLFYVELYIDTPSPDVNDAALAQLSEHSEAIEAQIGAMLVWDQIENRKGNRVYAGLEGNIDSPPERLEEFQQWAVDLLPKFRSAFEPRIAALGLDALAATEEAAP